MKLMWSWNTFSAIKVDIWLSSLLFLLIETQSQFFLYILKEILYGQNQNGLLFQMVEICEICI